jgi:antitoxin MazE
MKAKIITIGNSKGIRLPKSLLDQLGFENEVQLEATKDRLIIRPLHVARFDWAKSFHAMAQTGDDRLLDDYVATSWDKKEWEWK